MTFAIAVEQPPLRVDSEGTVRIGETRVTLDTLVTSYRNGATAEQIVQQFPVLSLAEVHAAIAYVLSHQEQVDLYLSEREHRADEVRRVIESDPQTQQIRQRLLARGGAKGPTPTSQP